MEYWSVVDPHHSITPALQCDLAYPVTPQEEIDIVEHIPEE
jgi:hypothetical protein